MLLPDPRGYRVALVADAVLNDRAAGYDVSALLFEAEFGMIVPPPVDFVLPSIASTIEYLVDDLEDYRRQGYRVLVIGTSSVDRFGTWSDLVEAELDRRGVSSYEHFDVDGTEPDDLRAVLVASAPPAIG